MRYKRLLFDADNTLFDFDKAEIDAYFSLSDKFPDIISPSGFDTYHEINQKIWKEHEKGLISKEELKIERFRRYIKECKGNYSDSDAREMAKIFLTSLSESSVLISGAKDVLSILKKTYSIYIVTNGITKVQKNRIKKSDIADMIDGIFISEEIGYSKPDSRFFDHVMNSIGEYNPEKYLVIGDSLSSDIAGALNSRIDSCLYNPKGIEYNNNEATYTINRLEEIIDVLR